MRRYIYLSVDLELGGRVSLREEETTSPNVIVHE
jgi:hypothetical protein